MDNELIIKVPIARYESLIATEANFFSLCDVLRADQPFNYKWYQAVVGKEHLPDIKEEGEKE